MTNSDRITIVLRTDGELGTHLATGSGDALYYCVIHGGCGHLPYASDWPEPDLRKWISKWQPLCSVEPPKAGDSLNQDDFGTTLIERPEPDNEKQVTFRGYQLYTLSEEAKDASYKSGQDMKVGEVSGFWRLVTLELAQAVLICDDPEPTPNNPRGP